MPENSPQETYLLIESAEELREWLAQNYESTESVWLIRWKKESGKPHVSWSETVDELLCFGWIDSLPRKLNEHKSMLRISPRNPKSNWSGINKRKVEKLIAEGRMQPSGLNLVHLAKENGYWDFLDDVEKLVIPSDLKSALDKHADAKRYFDRFPDSSKRGILEWIKSAKREETRKNRIEETVEKASRNIKANHVKGKDAGPKEESAI